MNSLILKLKSLLSNQFVRHNLVLFIGSMTVAFINYLYYPVMGRLMSNTGFGELQVMVSTFMQVSTVLSVLSLITIAILINEPDKVKGQSTIAQFEKLALYGGIILFVIFLFIAEPLRIALKFPTVYPFIVMGIVFLATIPLTFMNARLRAQKDFNSSSLTGAIGSITKLLFSILFVLMMLYTFGAALGILVSQLVAIAYAGYRLKKSGYTRVTSSKIDISLIRPQLPYALFVFVLSLLTTLQISIDVTIVKYYFSPQEAGNYAAIATIARIIFFLTGSVVAVMLSSISTTHTPKENMTLLKRSFLLITGLGGITTIIFWFFPTPIMHLLLGARYDAYTHLLPILSLAIFIGSLITLFTTYHIALRNYWTTVIVVTGSVFTGVLMLLSHGSLEDIINNLLAGNIAIFVGLAVFTFIQQRDALR